MHATSAPATTMTTAAIELFVALELSSKTWVIATHIRSSEKISQYRVKAGDVAGLLALIERLRMRAAGPSGATVRVTCCYEAGRDGFWLHRLLTQRSISNYVIDPASVHVSRPARRAKTDRLDAEALVRVLMAYVRGERKICSMVHVPTVEEEDGKRQHRERERLIAAKTAHVNRIKGLLATQGIRDANPLRVDWPGFLKRLRTGDGRLIPSHLTAELIREWQRLQLVTGMIKAIESECEQSNADWRHPQGLNSQSYRIQDGRVTGYGQGMMPPGRWVPPSWTSCLRAEDNGAAYVRPTGCKLMRRHRMAHVEVHVLERSA